MNPDHINCPIRPRVTLSDPDEPLEMIGFTIARYKFACKWMRASDRVLEVGCGEGFGCHFFSKHTAEVVGLDVDRALVERCQQTYQRENLRFIVDDILAPKNPIEPEYDTVVSLEMIEHIGLDEGRRMLANCAAYLKPGGMLVLSTPRSRDDRSVSRRHHHVYEYDDTTLVSALDDHFCRVMLFCQNDEYIYAGHPSTAWNYIACCFKHGE